MVISAKKNSKKNLKNLDKLLHSQFLEKRSSTKAIHQLFRVPRTCMDAQKLLLNQIFDCLVDNGLHL